MKRLAHPAHPAPPAHPVAAPGEAHAEPHPERADTDASLLAERGKADTELAKTRTAEEGEVDRVLEVARERAEDHLQSARARADRVAAIPGAAGTDRAETDRERLAVDEAEVRERAATEEALRAQRQDHRRALAALLDLEREATDDRLVVERARSDQVIATRDEVLAMVSHDLRNMLGTIAMSAGMLATQATAQGEGGAATLGLVRRIQRGTARMNRLVGDLLDIVSLDAGSLRVVLQPQDAVQVTRDAADAFQSSLSAKGLTLITELAAGSLAADLDRDRILQVLANLLSNALKFTPRGGRVTLRVEGAESDVRFSVTDTGIGIPASQAEHVFERFLQVNPGSGGLGLGLYISRCIVEAHGGTIGVESVEAGGSVFHFTLPRVARAA